MSDATLLEELKRIIRESGPMPVARFMDLCLTHPEHGYYRQAEAIGASGDFVTAPEISQIFGELIGIWVAATWQQMGAPDQLRVVELGPGRGTMMRDMLRAFRVVPGLLERVQPVLVEINARLRAVQHATLLDAPVPIVWIEALTDLRPDPVPTIVLANEFFDALPVTQYVSRADRWHERVVALSDKNRLCFAHGSAPQELSGTPQAIEGDILETRSEALRTGPGALLPVLRRLADNHTTVLLAIDYGYEGPAIGDTLQAMCAHGYVDVFQAPGRHDITAHVDFSEVAKICGEAGLRSDGLMTQAEFLAGLGFAERLERLCAGKEAKQVNAIETAAHRLVADPGMGSHFCVIGARTPELPPLAPFPLTVDTAGE